MYSSRTYILVCIVLVLKASLAGEVLRGTAIFLEAQRSQRRREMLATVGIILLPHFLTSPHEE